MGSWNVACQLSGLTIHPGDEVYVAKLVKHEPDLCCAVSAHGWAIASIQSGEYQDYGSVSCGVNQNDENFAITFYLKDFVDSARKFLSEYDRTNFFYNRLVVDATLWFEVKKAYAELKDEDEANNIPEFFQLKSSKVDVTKIKSMEDLKQFEEPLSLLTDITSMYYKVNKAISPDTRGEQCGDDKFSLQIAGKCMEICKERLKDE